MCGHEQEVKFAVRPGIASRKDPGGGHSLHYYAPSDRGEDGALLYRHIGLASADITTQELMDEYRRRRKRL